MEKDKKQDYEKPVLVVRKNLSGVTMSNGLGPSYGPTGPSCGPTGPDYGPTGPPGPA